MLIEPSIAVADADGATSVVISRQVLTFAAWAVLARALSVVSNIGSTAILSRVLPAEHYGRFAMFVSVATAASILAMFGANTGVVRFVGERFGRANRAEIHTTLMRCVRIAAFSTVIVALGAEIVLRVANASPLRLEDRTGLGLLLAGMIAAFASNNMAASSLRAMREPRVSSMLGAQYCGGAIASFLFTLLLLVLGGRGGLTIRRAAFLNILSLSLATGLGLIALRRRLHTFPRACHNAEDIQLPSYGILLRSCAWLALGQFLSISVQQADVWVAAVMCEPNELALYVGATRAVQVMSLPMTIVNMSLISVIPELFTQGRLGSLEYQLKRSARWAILFVLVACALFVCVGEDLLGIFLGTFYRHAFHVAAVLSLGQLVITSFGASELVLTMTGYERVIAVLNGVCALATLTVGMFAASQRGITGLAIAVTMVVATHALVRFLIVKRALAVSTSIAGWPWAPISRLRDADG